MSVDPEPQDKHDKSEIRAGNLRQPPITLDPLGTKEMRQLTNAASVGASVGQVVGQITAEKTTMGLKGIWQQVTQMTAVGLICFMFYLVFSDMLKGAREDRALLRETVSLVRQEGERYRELAHKEAEIDREATRKLIATVEKLIEKVGVKP